MNIIIVEDEKLAADKLEKMILKYDPEFSIQAKIRSVAEAIAWFENNAMPDLAFIDIQLTDGTIFDLVDKVKISCPVIFTTAYDAYALRAFELKSIDYLIKPFSQIKLGKAIDKLVDMKADFSDSGEEVSVFLKSIRLASRQYKSRFLVKFGSVLKSIDANDVAYFYSSKKMVFLVTMTGQRFVISDTLDELESSVDPQAFFRVNRQYIIGIKTINKVHTHFNGRLKLDLNPDTEEELYISNRRVAAFKDWMNQ